MPKAELAGSGGAVGGPFSDAFERGLLFDGELPLTRDEAITRFFTPKSGCENLTPTEEHIFVAGSLEQCFINPSTAFIAPQIRDIYDGRRIVRLGRNIIKSENGQLQNCGVAFVSSDQAEEYLGDLNAYFQSDIKVEDLSFHEGFGVYVITMFGHNRQMGIAAANLEENGHPDVGTLMMAKVFRNPSFWQVIGGQAVENTGEKPPMWDRARSIVMYKELRAKRGNPATQSEVAEKFNVDTDQIWRAERYDALPVPIKDLVVDKRLPYSGAFELDALLQPYGEDYTVDLAQKLAARQASGPQIMKAIKARLSVLKLTAEAQYLVDEEALSQAEAAALAEVSDVLSGDDVNELLLWLTTARPKLTDFKNAIKQRCDSKLNGDVGLFDSSHGIEEDRAVKDRLEEIRRGNVMAGVQATFNSIDHHLSGLRAAVSAGLVGDAAGGNWLSDIMPEHLKEVVESIGSAMDESQTIDDLYTRLNKSEALGPFADEICEVLKLLDGETAERQQERKIQIAALAAKKTVPETVQVGMF